MSKLYPRLIICLLCANCGRINFEAQSDGAIDVSSDGPASADAARPLTASLLGVAHLGGSQADLCYSLAMNASGRHVIAARFSGTADLLSEDFQSAGATDIFLASWGGDGTHLATWPFGDNEPQGGNGVEINDANDIIITGDLHGSVDFGDGLLTSEGNADWYVARFDGDGAHQWSFSAGSPEQEFGHDVRVAADGSSVIVGTLRGQGRIGSTNLDWKGALDALILRVGPDGSLLWRRVLGGPGDDDATGVAITTAGDIVAGGSFSDSVDFGGGTLVAAARAAFITAMDSQGTYRWDAVIDGPGNEFIYGMSTDQAGNVYATGSYETGAMVEGRPLPDGDASSGFVASFTADGALRWINTAGGSDVDIFHDVAVRDGEAYVVGYFTGTNSLFPDAPEPPMFRDGLVLAIDINTGDYLWAQRLSETTVVGVGTNGDGLVAVSGYFGTTANFGDGVALDSRGANDVFVARYGLR